MRTKLTALTVIPLALAAVLAALRVADSAHRSHSAAARDALIIGAVMLLALIFLPLLARSILKPLRVLRASAFDVADRRLPGVIETLRTGDGRTSDIKIDPVPVHSREDVGQVARAFDAVHSEAVRLATEQAALRANVNDMFVNLSRRSQSLVERQLRLIDELELGEQDSERLGALFRLDHLATRMRRNGENLLVLAGAELQQRSGEPVPIVDVLRAAVSEIEDYRRVVMQPLPRAQVSGLAVNDIVHLVAELLDNATAYSDPETQVHMNASLPPDGGLVIEISDVGTGLPHARIVEINNRLAAPPAVDVSVSRQMGLFVVGRLAERHNVRVRLAANDDAGVTVTVTLPQELVSGTTTGPGGPSMVSAPLPQLAPLPAPSSNGTTSFAPPTFADLPRLGQLSNGAEPTRSEPNGSEPVVASPDLLDDLRGEGSDADTPIFQAMVSRWFTEHSPGTVTAAEPAGPAESAEPAAAAGAPAASGPPASTASINNPSADPWRSAADAGWQAAAEATTSASGASGLELTAAGLPKRRPKAFLVPGSAAGTATNGRPRSAEAARERLSSFQRGVNRGRHEASGASGAGGTDQALDNSSSNDHDHDHDHVWEAHR